MAKRKGPPASHLKVMIWETQVQVYISKDMLCDKKVFGEGEGNRITIHPVNDSIYELLDTFVHEILHIHLDEYESADEDEKLVTHCSHKVMKSLTGFERMRLFLKLAQSLKK